MFSSTQPIYRFGHFLLDTKDKSLLYGDEEIPIRRREHDLLKLLLEAEGHLVTKEAIMREVWEGRIVEEANIPQQVSTLRRKLRAKDPTQFIKTVHGRGYRLISQGCAPRRIA
jgi:DNA-binding winged helix-turn-helix (wHTH) protein